MAGGFLDSLRSTFGAADEGPDPTRLLGLLEYIRQGAGSSEECLSHVERMRGRIQEAHRDRQGGLEGRRSQLEPGLLLLLDRNVNACKAVDDALAALQGDLQTGLEAYEAAVREFLESSEQLAGLASGGKPLCPRCGSFGDENVCPSCSLDRLIPDPEFAGEEFERAEVNEEFFAVFQAYQAILEGRAGLSPLTQALQPLEFSLLEAQALCEQAVDQEPENDAQQQLLQVVNAALEGLQRMHGVEQSRSMHDLNQGWMQVFRSGATLTRLLPRPS